MSQRPAAQEEYIEIFGAREHNLKNLDVKIPRNKVVVITGLSGSGKSSLAFDTIYAEGQRRYMESFSAYARSFLGGMERPDVDKINGLSPVIAIEQKTTSKNPRSTVGTVTEIYDFMRLLFARAADAYSYHTGNRMIRQTEDQIIEQLLTQFLGKKIELLAPLVKGRKGHYRELFEQLRKLGFSKVRIDGVMVDLVPKMQVDRYKIHDIELVIDRVVVEEGDRFRITQSLKSALQHGKGVLMVRDENASVYHFSKYLMDPETGRESIFPDPKLSITRGGIAPLGEYRDIWIFKKIEALLKHYKCSMSTPIKDLPESVIEILLYGDKVEVAVDSVKYPGTKWNTTFEGIINFLQKYQEWGSDKTQDWVSEFTVTSTCPDCQGYRLKKEALHFKLDQTHIGELAMKDIQGLSDWFDGLESRLSERQQRIAAEVLKEIRKRIGFLLDIGLDYLSLNRPLRSLSGGEAQRIRLATQIGTQLVGVLYILDEPSIGLHQRDNVKLIQALKQLRDLGNSVLVVEHDKDMMVEADYVIDLGPGAGRHGGHVVAAGTPAQILQSNTLTARYLNGEMGLGTPKSRRSGTGEKVVLRGARGNNLKNVTLELPLGTLILITGVSGSGKSTLIHETLFPIFNREFYHSKKEPMPYSSIEGLQFLDKVIEVDQSPIGRTPRSNPATYTGMFSDIRTLFTELPESKIRGYKPGRFSFNVKGGRCEDCEGAGMKLVEMDFLPDVHIPCETCKGKRYNRETLEVRFKGKSISDVLDMTVEQALEFFEFQPKILRKITTLHEVGLGYITLGQHATTLSGGEAQRVKLATELSKKDTGKTVYILDEPTTGLHFQDIDLLMTVLQKLVDKGNTVLVIEHNMDVIKLADYVVDLGPEGGNKGGSILVQGTPEQVAAHPQSHTGRFLKQELHR